MGAVPGELRAEAAIAGVWGVGAIQSAALPTSGTVNRTILLRAAGGRFVLRAYRHRARAPIDREHALIAHAAARGVPAVLPVPLPGGDTVLERDGRLFALFPWAAGLQVARAAVGEAETDAMGAALGRLHLALRDFPPVDLPRRPESNAPDRRVTLARMNRVAAVIQAALPADPVAAGALARLTGQRAYLEQLPPPGESGLVAPAAQAAQPIHGDYQETNLFFAGGRVSAIIDWEQPRLAPPAWEVVRALDFVFGFDPVRCRRFLSAYRAERALPLADMEAAVADYDCYTSHNLWLYETCYLEGDRRVARFLQEPGSVPFVPVAERWARARAAWAPG